MWHARWPSAATTDNPDVIAKKVEMLFAHFKRILKMDRLRLRGITGARDEFLLAAIAQNLRRMAKRLCPTVPSSVLAYT